MKTHLIGLSLIVPALCFALEFKHQTIDDRVQIGYGTAIGDVDGDGKPDILLADKKQFVWYRNPDWKKFVMAENLTQRDNVCIAARDIDGDGKVEVAVGGQWNPGDTVNSGSVHYLIPPKDRTQKWEAVKLHNEPTVHRMRWVKIADKDFVLVVAPLHGRGNKGGAGAGVKLLAYAPPKNPKDEWKTTVLEDTMHATHNLDPCNWDPKSASEEILYAGKEGAKSIAYVKGTWTNAKLPAVEGAGEIRMGHLGDRKPFIATIEPLHGERLVVYTDNPRTRTIIDDTYNQGHAIATADLDGDGDQEIVAGWRNKNKDGKVGVKVYTHNGTGWDTAWVDDNGMATEDLRIGDLNGDGHPDIVAAGRATKNLKIYWNQAKKTAASGGDWRSWRGPGFTGRAPDGTYPVSWDGETGHAWKVELPGRGCSTPILLGDQILISTPAENQNAVVCYNRNGEQQWLTKLGPERAGKHKNGSGSNPSPVTDGEFLFVYFKSGEVAGLDLDGKTLWQTNLQETYAKDSLFWDLGTSLVLTENHVVATVMHKGGSFLIAFEKANGEIAWKVDRNYDCPVENDHGYNTPIVYNEGGTEAIQVWGAEHFTSHNAKDGSEIWSCGDFNPARKANWVTVASHVYVGNTAVIPYARGNELIGVKTGGKGDVTTTHKTWKRNGIGTFVPTPIVDGKSVLILGDKGKVSCIVAETGETEWEGDLPKHRAKYYASPFLAGGNIYCTREDGVIFVASANEGFELLSENNMGERVIASLVPMDGKLLLRGEKHLFCIAGN